MKYIKQTIPFCFIAAPSMLYLSCGSPGRQIFKARQIFDKYPNEAEKYCGDKFPVADSTISVKTDTIKGKTTDYTPALANLQTLLDLAKTTLDQKQGRLIDLAEQLSFTKSQLDKATGLINSLSSRVSSIKANYKPCEIDTIKSTYTKIRVNTAKILALTAQNVQDGQDKEKLQNNLQDETIKASHRLYWIIGLCLLIAVYLCFKIYRLFSGGVLLGTLFH